jgi:FtsP/CotA-like multicopper oxidase with cupredoxin domain
VVEEIMSPQFDGTTSSDNNLINGRMNFDCSKVPEEDQHRCTPDAGFAKFRFQSGKRHRLRFINSGSEGVQHITIDGHNMTVMANDFVEIEPYETKVLALGIGQRVDVVVQAHDDSHGAFWLRANLTCSPTTQPKALAAILYEDADEARLPESTPWNVTGPPACANAPLESTVPYYPLSLPEPSWTEEMNIGAFRNQSNNLLWTFGVSLQLC